MMIVYLRVVPGFWVAVEEAQRPELRSSPLVIGGLPHQRGIVREANQLAQHAGVQPGMTLAQAHQQCPGGIFLLPDLARYELVWEEICEILRHHTPLVEPVEMGQAVCDLAGCERFWPDERSAGQAIGGEIERSTGVIPSLGMASNRLVAQLASMFTETDGVTVIDRSQERAFLADLPLTLLPGIDPRLALTFQVLGLTTISQFAALPSSAVKQRFGTAGEQLHRYARGIDPRPVLPPAEKSCIVARYECEDGSIEEAMDGIRTLADTCADELQGRGAAGRLVGLTLCWAVGSIRLPSLPKQERSEASRDSAIPPASKVQPLQRRASGEPRALPIPYRLHSSRLPQPLEEPPPQKDPARGSSLKRVTNSWSDGRNTNSPRPPALTSSPHPGATRAEAQVQQRAVGASELQEVVAMVRTPIDTAPPLLERTQRLLLQIWPRARSHALDGNRTPRLLAIELKIGEFAKPSQLSFSDFDRLDEGGTLQGLSTERRQALVRHDKAFEARYGTTAFQHVAGLDSGNILTERRFRWENGLPWNSGGAVRKRS